MKVQLAESHAKQRSEIRTMCNYIERNKDAVLLSYQSQAAMTKASYSPKYTGSLGRSKRSIVPQWDEMENGKKPRGRPRKYHTIKPATIRSEQTDSLLQARDSVFDKRPFSREFVKPSGESEKHPLSLNTGILQTETSTLEEHKGEARNSGNIWPKRKGLRLECIIRLTNGRHICASESLIQGTVNIHYLTRSRQGKK